MPRVTHPLQRDDEVLLGSMFASDVRHLRWKSARAVTPAIDSDGNTIAPRTFVSVLVLRAELKAAGVHIPDRGPVQHLWKDP
jgi:hypothetical protein